uniref:Uncharacterized protein n=1 Tax=Eutreptiella gymnastica TaxID=73025 RepID=A0A7S1J0A4_9EUGL|mmetsp:Transcript_56452/g.100525  ORF Transcript_56452/g.100525 Transcript_56452/m.100525 type:complete len:115 (+) Transcript_56452:46-390(+)
MSGICVTYSIYSGRVVDNVEHLHGHSYSEGASPLAALKTESMAKLRTGSLPLKKNRAALCQLEELLAKEVVVACAWTEANMFHVILASGTSLSVIVSPVTLAFVSLEVPLPRGS